MSITNAYIIPKNEMYVPNQTEIEAISNEINKEDLRSTYDKNSSLQFYDCGENFESILCPLCISNLDMDWWQKEMCRASECNFTDINFVTPCCHKNSSLNKLDYHFAQGFSLFAILIEDYESNTRENLLLSKLQAITGEEWKIILARY